MDRLKISDLRFRGPILPDAPSTKLAEGMSWLIGAGAPHRLQRLVEVGSRTCFFPGRLSQLDHGPRAMAVRLCYA